MPGHVPKQFLARLKPHLFQVHVHHIGIVNLQKHSVTVAENLLQLLDGGELRDLGGAVAPGDWAEIHGALFELKSL